MPGLAFKDNFKDSFKDNLKAQRETLSEGGLWVSQSPSRRAKLGGRAWEGCWGYARARDRTGACAQVRPRPSGGSLRVLCGDCHVLRCPSGLQIAGDGLLACAWKGTVARWSSGTSVFKRVPPWEACSFEVAVVASAMRCANQPRSRPRPSSPQEQAARHRARLWHS